MLDLSVIILARNEELHIRRCLENILPVAKEVFVIDCFSTDNTAAICREYPRVHDTQHEWPGLYALQFNWALDNCPITAEWVLRLDADEWFMPEALEELKAKLPALPPDVTGIIHKRRHIFLGRWMKQACCATERPDANSAIWTNTWNSAGAAPLNSNMTSWMKT